MRLTELSELRVYYSYTKVVEIGKIDYYCNQCGEIFFSEISYTEETVMQAYLIRHQEICRK